MAPVLALLTVSGKGRITVREQCYELNAGSLVLVPSAFPMEYGTDVTAAHPEWEFYWLNLEGSYVRRLARTLWEDGRGVHTCRQPAGFRTLFQSLMEESAVSHLQERRRSDRVQAICDRLLDECFFDTPPAADRRAGEILQYLQDRYQQDITLAQLGERFYLSVNHLIRDIRPMSILSATACSRPANCCKARTFPLGKSAGGWDTAMPAILPHSFISFTDCRPMNIASCFAWNKQSVR